MDSTRTLALALTFYYNRQMSSITFQRLSPANAKRTAIFMAMLALMAITAACRKKSSSLKDTTSILVVSYDPGRPIVKEANRVFVEESSQRGAPIAVRESFGGSAKQAQAVVDGLAADVILLGIADDARALVANGVLRPESVQTAPFTSTVVFVVRKGNPQGIHDWRDLVKEGVALVAPSPKTASAAKLTYLAAWGWALRQPGGNEQTARALVAALYTKAVVLDATARAASTTFVQNGIGDVLVTWENEAYLAQKEQPDKSLEIVRPSLSIRACPVLAIVDSQVEAHGTREAAARYIALFSTDHMQEVAAQNFFHVSNPAVADRYRAITGEVPQFTVEEVFGSWAEINAKHFGTRGIIDEILDARR